MKTVSVATAFLFVVCLAVLSACDNGGQPESTPTSTPTSGLPPETLLSEEFDGVEVQLVYQPMAYVFATTPEEYREAKAALEERLPSLVPDPCLVRWSAPVMQMVLERDDYVTSGCQ
ncbi:MAG: hypothetical protein AMJ76_03800 [Dehalococcoidia bacterium SM23_28_1]|nr:MAG: hypothetical protein AMJ76_03800 [Dehalococcoidia bacterium SM23_28_1]